MMLNDGSGGSQMRPQIQTQPRPMVGAQQPMMRPQPSPWGRQAGPIQPRPTREQVQARSFGSMGQPMQPQPTNPMMAGMTGPPQTFSGAQAQMRPPMMGGGMPMGPGGPPMGGMDGGAGNLMSSMGPPRPPMGGMPPQMRPPMPPQMGGMNDGSGPPMGPQGPMGGPQGMPQIPPQFMQMLMQMMQQRGMPQMGGGMPQAQQPMMGPRMGG